MKSEQKLKASVDIDNTLLNFSTFLHEEMVKINPDVPEPFKWKNWDFWDKYMTRDEFYVCIDIAQRRLPEAEPFLYIDRFLEKLSRHFEIVITSHRTPPEQHYPIVKKWLDDHGLYYDEIWLSDDKTKRLKEFDFIVDDSPVILRAAAQAKIPAIGLLYGWNMKERNELRGVEVFDSVIGMLGYINYKYGGGNKSDVVKVWESKVKKQSIFSRIKLKVKRLIRKLTPR